MALTTTVVTTNTTTLIATLNQRAPRVGDNGILISAGGTFGGGTVTFQYSLDGGTTKITLKDGANYSADDISVTANHGFVWDAPTSTGGTPIRLYAVTTGSSGASITFHVVDQNYGAS